MLCLDLHCLFVISLFVLVSRERDVVSVHSLWTFSSQGMQSRAKGKAETLQVL